MDTIDASNPHPTAQVPLLSGTRLSLATGLLQGKSYYELGLMFQRLADDAQDLPGYLQGYGDDYITRLEEMSSPRSDIWRILHTIPRQVLVSLVLGTFARDFMNKSGKPDHYRDMRGFGVYAVAIAVAGRDGAWLKPTELSKLIDHLERYIDTSTKYWDRKCAAPRDADERSARDFVTNIDNMFGQHAPEKGPRFVLSNEADVLDSWRALVSSLRRRRDNSLAIDPSGRKPLLQGPLYTGCSVTLELRSKAYDPQSGRTRKLTGVNRAYAIMMSLMMYMSLDPVHVCRCVTRLWNRKDLPIAEILVAALANSYISQDGFNRIACGGESGMPRAKRISRANTGTRARSKSPRGPKTPPAAHAVAGEEQGEEDESLFDNDAEDYVKGRESFFYDNIFASVEELRKRHAFVKEFCGLQPLFDAPGDNTVDSLLQLENDLEEVQEIVDQIEHHKKLCLDVERAAEESIDVLRQDLEIMDLLGQLRDLLN